MQKYELKIATFQHQIKGKFLNFSLISVYNSVYDSDLEENLVVVNNELNRSKQEEFEAQEQLVDMKKNIEILEEEKLNLQVIILNNSMLNVFLLAVFVLDLFCFET